MFFTQSPFSGVVVIICVLKTARHQPNGDFCMKMIEISGNKGSGKYLIVDDNSPILQHKSWTLHTGGYATSSIKSKKIYAHHLVVGKPKDGYEIDHINLNKLDNRKENLREISIQENRKNKLPYGRHKIRLLPKFISKTPSGRYRVEITLNKKTLKLGTYDSIIIANQRVRSFLEVRGL